MTLLSLIGHQAKVTNCIRSRFCKYKPGCGVSHNSNHRAAELVTRAIPQLSQETEHFSVGVKRKLRGLSTLGYPRLQIALAGAYAPMLATSE